MSNHHRNINAPLPGMRLGPLLDSKEVATILKISHKTVHKLAREGKLACVQVTARDRRFIYDKDRKGGRYGEYPESEEGYRE
jgi:hypothetical protein